MLSLGKIRSNDAKDSAERDTLSFCQQAIQKQTTSRPMPTIELSIEIHSNIETCFDLARSIDFHTISTSRTNEKAIGGRTSGLINLGEQVTWQATHFGIRQKLTSKITTYERPFHFRDEQVKGIFKFIVHDHYFEQGDGKVIMKDVFKFQSPVGFIGQVFDKFVLKKYLTKFLFERNGFVQKSSRYQELNLSRNFAILRDRF